MAAQVCVDASLVLLLLLPHELTPQAGNRWEAWLEEEVEIVSAPLFFAEVTSVLRERVHFARISPEEGQEALDSFLGFKIREVNPPDLQRRAWGLAKQYNRPRTYDTQYLAVANVLGCELWTADRRLVNAVPLPWVRWVGEYKASGA